MFISLLKKVILIGMHITMAFLRFSVLTCLFAVSSPVFFFLQTLSIISSHVQLAIHLGGTDVFSLMIKGRGNNDGGKKKNNNNNNNKSMAGEEEVVPLDSSASVGRGKKTPTDDGVNEEACLNGPTIGDEDELFLGPHQWIVVIGAVSPEGQEVVYEAASRGCGVVACDSNLVRLHEYFDDYPTVRCQLLDVASATDIGRVKHILLSSFQNLVAVIVILSSHSSSSGPSQEKGSHLEEGRRSGGSNSFSTSLLGGLQEALSEPQLVYSFLPSMVGILRIIRELCPLLIFTAKSTNVAQNGGKPRVVLMHSSSTSIFSDTSRTNLSPSASSPASGTSRKTEYISSLSSRLNRKVSCAIFEQMRTELTSFGLEFIDVRLVSATAQACSPTSSSQRSANDEKLNLGQQDRSTTDEGMTTKGTTELSPTRRGPPSSSFSGKSIPPPSKFSSHQQEKSSSSISELGLLTASEEQCARWIGTRLTSSIFASLPKEKLFLPALSAENIKGWNWTNEAKVQCVRLQETIFETWVPNGLFGLKDRLMKLDQFF